MFNIVGNPTLNRRDILNKVTGKAVYAYDINPSHINANNMIYMGMIHSPYPHANIVSIDGSAAEEAGYIVITGKDMPPFSLWGGGRSHTPLPITTVRYPGEAIAAVGAPTTDQVEDAINLVKVNLEPLPFVLDQEEALKSSAPQIWPNGNIPAGGFTPETGPIPATIHVAYGDVNAGFGAADEIVEVRLDTQIEQHFEFEPRACIAWWTGATSPAPGAAANPSVATTGSILNVWASNQFVHSDQSNLAQYFGIPVNNVVVRTGLGGTEGGGVLGNGLGDKSGGEELAIAAFMALKSGSAVKYGPTRFDQSLMTHHRFPIRGYMKLGGKKDGTFTAMQAKLIINGGAYGGSLGSDTVSDLVNLYTVPNVVVDAVSVNTNAYHFGAPMRDVGESQGHFIMEVAMDMLAEKLGLDPMKFRLQNLRTAANAVDPMTGFPYSGFGQPEAFNKAVATFNWSGKWQGWGVPSSVSGPNNVLRNGVGIAAMNAQKGALSPPVTGQLQVNTDGSVIAYTGLTDHGAGGNTAFAIMAAEALGLTSFSNIKMVMSDTSLTTNSGVTAGSRSTRVCGMAFIAAAANLKNLWLPILQANQYFTDLPSVKSNPNSGSQNLVFSQNTISSPNSTQTPVPFATAASLIGPYNAQQSPPLPPFLKGIGVFIPPPKTAYRVGGVKIAEVQVNIETAEVRVVNFSSGIDIGRVIFPKGAMSQVRGGLFMGIGETLYQELVNDPTTGSYTNPNFHDFKIPTIMEVPDNVTADWSEYGDKLGPFGAKGLGENTLIAVSPAIANALSNALGGYRFTSLPIRREDVVAAIQWAKQNKKI
jgi:CO/xanthine dehydrogenase Mo-binding subunit